MSILVRILSRSLEAKLIVCSCICIGDGKVRLLPEYKIRLRLDKHTLAFAEIFSKVRPLYPYRCAVCLHEELHKLIHNKETSQEAVIINCNRLMKFPHMLLCNRVYTK